MSTDTEVSRTEDIWKGPFQETGRYGYLTGHSYVRCRDCGIEVLTSGRENAGHREGCRLA